MALSTAYNIARSSLLATQSQIGIVSRNTSSATDPTYSRKIASLVSQNGPVKVTVTRASSAALYVKMLDTTSDAATTKALLEGLEKLNQSLGDTDVNQSPAAYVGALTAALQNLGKSPDSSSTASAFLAAAKDMVASLNKATTQVQSIREETDRDMADSVARINDLLVKFKSANDDVVRGTAVGADISDSLDTRDAIVAQLSEEVGISVVTREGNDMAIYTDSGVPLFDREARAVTFSPIKVYGPDTVGNAVYIDGVQVTGSGAPMPLSSGALVGYASVRDSVATNYQNQLDEIARMLITAFAEKDQTGGGGADQAGIFKTEASSGIPAGPPAPAPTGLAALIRVSDAIDPEKGGSYEKIRDGGINGAAYAYNPNAGTDTAYTDRLSGLADELKASRSVNPNLGLGSVGSIEGIASASVSWVQAARQKASSDLDYQSALLSQASDVLSNATDVNMDDETALMLQLEKSYSASAKLISVIDDMFRTVLDMVR